jgi:hypothetical protein
MATMKPGTTAKPWGSYCMAKHLRADGKRGYWHRERPQARALVEGIVDEQREPWVDFDWQDD